MSTVGAIIDRLYREFLAPSDQTPVVCTLDGAIDDSTTSVVVDVSMLSIEERYLLSPGVVVEVGLEQMLVESYDEASLTLTVTRGHAGTTAATHADNDVVTLMPAFSRQVAFDAVADEVVGLQPLWGLETVTLTGQTTPIDAPADAVGVASVTWVGTSSELHTGTAKLVRNYPPSATGRAVTLPGVPSGKTAYVTYKKEFSRPTAESDTLASLLIEEQWVPILLYGAAARMSSYVDPTLLNIDWSVKLDQNEQVPMGSGSILESRLRRVRNTMHAAALQRLHMEYPPVISYSNPFNPVSRV